MKWKHSFSLDVLLSSLLLFPFNNHPLNFFFFSKLRPSYFLLFVQNFLYIKAPRERSSRLSLHSLTTAKVEKKTKQFLCILKATKKSYGETLSYFIIVQTIKHKKSIRIDLSHCEKSKSHNSNVVEISRKSKRKELFILRKMYVHSFLKKLRYAILRTYS